jgi:predicted nuclease of predicted toxin-antitoxin system
MRVLIDECIPRRFKAYLEGHACQTVPEAGFTSKKNGELLRLAEGQFDVLITLDKGIQYQHNLAGNSVAILIIRVKSNRLEDVIVHAAACLNALKSIRSGQVVKIPAT